MVLHGLAGHPGTYRVSGPEAMTATRRLAVLGEVLGRPLREQPMSDEEVRAELSRTTPPAYVDAFFAFYRAGLIDETTVLPTVEQALGRPPRSFRDWVTDHVGEFGVAESTRGVGQ